MGLSLRQQGFKPHMVKLESGAYVTVCPNLDEARAKLTEAAGELFDFVNAHSFGDIIGPISGKVNAANALLGETESVPVPTILEAGFNPKVKRDFWGNVIP